MSKWLDKVSWLLPMGEVEHGAVDQIRTTAERDFCLKMAIMPDVHQGYDLPIGAVALFDNVISASAVGYDQGCGMCLVNTRHTLHDLGLAKPDGTWLWDELCRVRDRIMEAVPMGTGQGHDSAVQVKEFSSQSIDKPTQDSIRAVSALQKGTLGSGNHFLRVDTDEQGHVCIVVHSGSRKPGHTIASWWMKHSSPGLPKGYFDLRTDMGQSFYADLLWGQSYALENRLAMIKAVLGVLGFTDRDIPLMSGSLINENHNHAIVEDMDGRVLHRKGATPVEAGARGVIPINIVEPVYVTRGLGNDLFLRSASHGAGRVLSRKKAKQQLDVDEYLGIRDRVVTNINEGTLDESPHAYKNGEEVISRQDGTVVEVISRTYPVICLQGTK